MTTKDTTDHETIMENMRQELEEAIAEARGLFSAMYDEDAPDIADSMTRRSVQTRTNTGMEMLDGASSTLWEFGGKVNNLLDSLAEADDEVQRLGRIVEDSSFLTLADNLLFELEGRMLTDDPDRTLAWVQAALREVTKHNDPEDLEDANTIVWDAVRLEVA